MTFLKQTLITLVIFTSITVPTAWASEAQQRIVARVGATPISAADFTQAYEESRRWTFYHGKPAPDQQPAFQRQVSQQIIQRILLLQEAQRRGIKPRPTQVEAALANYTQRYKKNTNWQRNRAQLLPGLRARLEEADLLQQLEQSVRITPTPTRRQLQDFYATHQDKFLEPAQRRVSLILLQVEPSSPSSVWNDATVAANKLRQQLVAGADFASLAQQYSGDSSAAQGGDMGYLHEGMLSPPIEQALQQLQLGDISEPIKVLEGIALVHLTDYKPPQQHPLAAVHERASELWQQQQSDNAWQRLLQKLQTETPIEIYDSALMVLDPA